MYIHVYVCVGYLPFMNHSLLSSMLTSKILDNCYITMYKCMNARKKTYKCILPIYMFAQ